MNVNINDNTDKVLAELAKAKQRALERIGLAGEGYAKKECPVDTGNLRNSITHAADEETAYIGTNTEYAAFV